MAEQNHLPRFTLAQIGGYQTLERQTGGKEIKEIKAIVQLANGEELTVDCPNGKLTTGVELRDRVATLLRLGLVEWQHFAIWVASEHLQLQMKPHHAPFKIMKKWMDLLQQYTAIDPQSELPILTFRRSCFVHQPIERKITDTAAVELFFDEMTFNVIHSHYPCSLDEAVMLGAIHLQLKAGNDANKHTVKEILGCTLPVHLQGEISEKKWIKTLLSAREEISLIKDEAELHAMYLQIGRAWPNYGCTFFKGYLEPDTTGFVLRELVDEPVLVGVNLDGIYVLSEKTYTMKLCLGYNEFQFNSYDAVGQTHASHHSFLIRYDDVLEPDPLPGVPRKKLEMVIWTQQAAMIDTLVVQMIEEMSKHTDFKAIREQEVGSTLQPFAGARRRSTKHVPLGTLDKLSTLLHLKARPPKEKAFTLTALPGKNKLVKETKLGGE